MGEWSFLGDLFEHLQAHSTMLGRFWLGIMLIFRILILGTVASDLFEDEQEEFSCNTLQPGCKQVCYDHAFPISLYRFWVFHIVLISTPALLYLMYVLHHLAKKKPSSSASAFDTASDCSQGHPEERRLRQFYLVNVAFRLMAEVGVLVGQWWLYGFRLEAQFPCYRFPCPYTVDCFTSRPAEKTVFLVFYFGVGVVSGACSLVELLYAAVKWFCPRKQGRRGMGMMERSYGSQNLSNLRKQEEEANLRFGGGGKALSDRALSDSALSSVRVKGGPVRSSGARKTSSVGHKSHRLPSSRSFVA